jgi:hypothetical protein
MKTMKMFATTTLLIAGILLNQAFAQNAQNATPNTQKSIKTEMKASSQNAAVSTNQKAVETKAVNSQAPAAKPATQVMPAGSKAVKSEPTAMNTKASTKHHRGHKAHKSSTGSLYKSESTKTAKPVEKPKAH